MKVFGAVVDDETRCVHYHTEKDIIAIRFKCCQRYYPCYQCHEEHAGHPIVRWATNEWDELAILCGKCQTEMSIRQYMSSSCCPHCQAILNERCANHYHLYFETGE